MLQRILAVLRQLWGWKQHAWILFFSILATVITMHFVSTTPIVLTLGYWITFLVLLGIWYFAFWEKYDDQAAQQTAPVPAPAVAPAAAPAQTTDTTNRPPLKKSWHDRLRSWVFEPWYFNPIKWQLFRVVSSLVFSAVIVGVSYALVWGFSHYFNYPIAVSETFWWGTLLLIALALGLIENKELEEDKKFADKVPPTNFLAMVTLWGMPLPIYRTTGDYSWIGTSMGFGRSDRAIQEFTDANGYIHGGDIPFVVWNNSNSQEDNRSIIEANAKNDAVVKATLVLILQFFDPRKALDSEDPALDIGNRARQEIREMFRAFVDTDIPSLLDAVGPVLTGNTLLTYFLPEPVGVHKQGSMIKTSGENSIFYLLNDDEQKEVDKLATEDEKEAKLETHKKKVREMIQNLAHKKTKERFWPPNGDVPEGLPIDVVRVKNPIREVTEELGLNVRRVTIGSITLSPEVTKAAQKASAESHERAAQVASAKANREARKAMLPSEENGDLKDLDNPAWRDAMMIAAAQDNPEAVKVIHIPGLEALGALAKNFLPADKKDNS